MKHGEFNHNSDDLTESGESLLVSLTCPIIIDHCGISIDVIAYVLARPQQQRQQVLSATTQSNDDEDGLLPILDLVNVIVHMDFCR